jgi:bifunctional isochorismate lyase/aryl carrier protein
LAIPPIAAYRLPTAADLPPNRVRWSPEPGRCALLIHDMQRYFTDPFTGPGPLPEVVANIARLRAALGVPVIYSAQPGTQPAASRGLLRDFWGAGLPAGPGEQIVAGLAPRPGDHLLTKHRYSAFARTDLDAVLAGRDQLLITGVYGHIGVLATATDAFMRDIEAFVVADAIADFSAAHHAGALRQVARTCGSVLTADAVAGVRDGIGVR